jgi:hypothetical protein
MLSVIHTECHSYWVSFMVSVANKTITLRVIMMSFVMLRALMLNVVI